MNADPVQPDIAELVAAAKRLRAARSACRQFLTLWALQQAVEHLQRAPHAAVENPPAHAEKRDWSILYRGSILDD
jgi:hypothetical protein